MYFAVRLNVRWRHACPSDKGLVIVKYLCAGSYALGLLLPKIAEVKVHHCILALLCVLSPELGFKEWPVIKDIDFEVGVHVDQCPDCPRRLVLNLCRVDSHPVMARRGDVV